MLKKEYIKELLIKKEYEKIHKYLYFEYSEMLYNFIKNKEENYEKKTLNEQIKYIMFNYPKYAPLMENLIEMISNDEDALIDSLNLMIDNYVILNEQLNQNNK